MRPWRRPTCPRCESEVDVVERAYQAVQDGAVVDVVLVGMLCLGCVAELRWREHRQLLLAR